MIPIPATFGEGTVVWKYALDLDDAAETVLTFAKGTILHVDEQHGQFVAWVAVIDKTATIARRVVIRGTGDPLPGGGLTYLNTCFSGPFVFHAFVGYAPKAVQS